MYARIIVEENEREMRLGDNYDDYIYHRLLLINNIYINFIIIVIVIITSLSPPGPLLLTYLGT